MAPLCGKFAGARPKYEGLELSKASTEVQKTAMGGGGGGGASEELRSLVFGFSDLRILGRRVFVSRPLQKKAGSWWCFFSPFFFLFLFLPFFVSFFFSSFFFLFFPGDPTSCEMFLLVASSLFAVSPFGSGLIRA